MNSLPQNSHLTLRLGQSCCRWSGKSRRVSLTEQRLGQGMTLKAQVEKWPWGGHNDRFTTCHQTLTNIQPHGWLSENNKRGEGEGGGDRSERIEAPHLQLLHLACPAAALLAVDAADGQSQDLLLQLWIWVDLRRKSGMRSVWQMIPAATHKMLEGLTKSSWRTVI